MKIKFFLVWKQVEQSAVHLITSEGLLYQQTLIMINKQNQLETAILIHKIHKLVFLKYILWRFVQVKTGVLFFFF